MYIYIIYMYIYWITAAEDTYACRGDTSLHALPTILSLLSLILQLNSLYVLSNQWREYGIDCWTISLLNLNDDEITNCKYKEVLSFLFMSKALEMINMIAIVIVTVIIKWWQYKWLLFYILMYVKIYSVQRAGLKFI